MKNSGQSILRESIKTVDTAENSLTFKYTLTVDNDRSEFVCDSGISPIYSLTIASFIDGVADDEQYFEDISPNQEDAERMFDIMSDNIVTPETAEYILKELLLV